MEFRIRTTCRRGCACPVSALLVPLPCLSTSLVSVPLTTPICLAMCLMRAATPGCLVENSAKLTLPTRRDIYRYVGMSLVFLLTIQFFALFLFLLQCLIKLAVQHCCLL